jgi:hypothetical protein
LERLAIILMRLQKEKVEKIKTEDALPFDRY